MSIADELRQRTFRYALRVVVFCRALPDTWEGREIGRQLLRAGMGTSSNYWSCCRGRSDAEFIAKLGVAEDETAEKRDVADADRGESSSGGRRDEGFAAGRARDNGDSLEVT